MATERLFGLETEYGLALPAPDRDGTLREALARDVERRAHTEWPSVGDANGSGVFLQNGARLYVDCGSHPEMTTPEVSNPWDAVRYVLAGERILQHLVASAPYDTTVGAPLLFKTNVDYLTRASWGCHESVLHTANPALLPDQIIPHLVSRVIYTGAGGFDPSSPGVEFVLSPRALFIDRPISTGSTSERGIFHTKDEPLGTGGHRLHIICGESLCSEIGMWLRTATTVLVVAMVEGGVQPGTAMVLDDPVGALRAVAGDATCRTPVAAASGRVTPAQIQRHFLCKAEQHAHADFMPPWTEAACREWRAMLDRLEHAPLAVSSSLDWAIKRSVFARVLARHGLGWDDLAAWTEALRQLSMPLGGDEWHVDDLLDPTPALRRRMRAVRPLLRARGLTWRAVGRFLRLRQALFECDLRFSQLGGDGLFASLDAAGVLAHHVPGVDNIEHAMENPPAVGRARLRGDVIRRVQASRTVFGAAWQYIVNHDEQTVLDLANPFETEERWAPAGWPQRWPPMRSSPFTEPGGAAAGASSRRSAALDRLVLGDYPAALSLLEALLGDQFQVASTRCHLARVYLLMGRDAEARLQVAAAWDLRAAAPRYVVGRTLWFLTLFALIDGIDASPWIGRLKTLGPDDDAQLDWTMEPVLVALRTRLSPEAHAIVSALFRALADQTNADALAGHAWWCDAQPVPID